MQEFRENYSHVETADLLNDVVVGIAGRIMLKRSSGSKLIFYTIVNDGESLQIMADASNATGKL